MPPLRILLETRHPGGNLRPSRHGVKHEGIGSLSSSWGARDGSLAVFPRPDSVAICFSVSLTYTVPDRRGTFVDSNTACRFHAVTIAAAFQSVRKIEQSRIRESV